MRGYIATEKPLEELIILTEFIVKVDVPVWFIINTASLDPEHFMLIIIQSRYMHTDLLKIADAVVQCKVFFAPVNSDDS